jgi:hypothetical protein
LLLERDVMELFFLQVWVPRMIIHFYDKLQGDSVVRSTQADGERSFEVLRDTLWGDLFAFVTRVARFFLLQLTKTGKIYHFTLRYTKKQ